MRVKLILISSLIAAIIGAGVPILIIWLTLGSFLRIVDPQFERRSNGWPSLVLLLLPLVAAALTSIFVYRRTSRRRKLQAALTLMLVTVLSCAGYLAALIFKI